MGKVADAAAGPEIHGEVGDVVAVQQDASRIRPGQADQDVKRRGFPCAIGPQQPNHFTLADFQVEVIDDLPSAIGLAEVDGLQLQHNASFLDPVQRQRSRTFRRIDNNRIIRKKQGQLTAGCRVS